MAARLEIGLTQEPYARHDAHAAHAAFRAEVGSRVRFARGLLGLSQDELATRAGVGRTFVSGIERGTHGLDAWRLRQLARALDRSLCWLLGDD
jgi:ribosome-binding protein aMBF1 (putative translation factor)